MTFKKLTILLVVIFLYPALIFAESIILKSGKSITGKIIEKTDKYIKIDFDGIPLTYYLDEIQTIDGVEVSSSSRKESTFTLSLPSESKTVNASKYILYVPSNINLNTKHPLVVAFSPSADAQSMIETWKKAAEKYKWIILASKEFRNGLTTPIFPSIVSILNQIIAEFPVDKTKIVATGLSGGGMCSYFFAFEYPELISAVVSNVGVIHPVIINREEGYKYVKGKLAVFLASPTDFNYKLMKDNQRFLEGLDWKTKWIEFEGGHTTASAFAFEQAAQWLEEQWFENK